MTTVDIAPRNVCRHAADYVAGYDHYRCRE
jgi:hypothetical protein